MAAGKGPTVTLTFAGDDKNLKRTMAAVGRSANRLNDDVDRVSKGVALSFAGMAAAASGGALLAAGALAAVPLAFAGIGIAAAAQSAQVKTAFTGLKDHVVKQVQEMAKPFEPVLLGIAEKARATFDKLAPELGATFKAVAPFVDTLATSLMTLVQGAMPGFRTAMESAKPIIDALGQGIAEMGPAISGFFTNMSGGASGAATGISVLFDAVNWLLPALGSLVGFLSEWSGVIVPLAGAVAGFAAVVWLVNAATAAWNAIMVVVRAATAAWAGAQWLLNAAMSANPIGIVVIAIAALVAAIVIAWRNCETFRNIVKAVWEAIKSAFSAGVEWIKGALAWFGSLPGKFAAWIGGAKDAIVRKFGEAVSWVRGLPGRIMSAIGSLGSLLASSGRALVDGFLRGIKGAWGRVTGWVRSGMQKLRNLWPFSPAKDGPFSGTGYVTHSGRALTEDFASSLRAGMGNVAAAASAVVAAARAPFTGGGLAAAANELLGHLGRGGKVFEDLSFRGQSANVGQHNDALAQAFQRSGSRDLAAFLRQQAGGAHPAAGGGGVNVHFSGNVDSAFATAFMKLVRTGQIQLRAA